MNSGAASAGAFGPTSLLARARIGFIAPHSSAEGPVT
jgi:hypothetical protein